jgi:formate hydrogenlyase transcriptional activator
MIIEKEEQSRNYPSDLPGDFSVDNDLGSLGIQEQVTQKVFQRVPATWQAANHLRFEAVVSGLSTRFINLSASRINPEIKEGLRILSNALGSDRTTLAEVDELTGEMVITHNWTRAGFPEFDGKLLKSLLPRLEERLRRGEVSFTEHASDLAHDVNCERPYLASTREKSSLVLPLRIAGRVVGAIATSCFRNSERWDDAILSRVQDIADIFVNAIVRKKAEENLQSALAEVNRLKERLDQETAFVREEIQLEHNHSTVVGNSAAIRGVLKKTEQVADTDSVALILGETGTGKELIARTIHDLSRRSRHPMIRINCAALPATLVESELFGREKGAYTGALAREIGRFELADKSTIFLDEIGELPLDLQSKLLRVLQEGEFERLGSPKTLRVDVRVLAATNRNLHAMVKEGKFRADLFYRLNVFPIVVPPLRERKEDIPGLVWHILKDLGKRMGRSVESVHVATMQEFQRYSWPGNVRELRNVIERNLILNTGPVFRAETPSLDHSHGNGLRRLDEVEAEHVRGVLQTTNWRVRGRGGAAETLGLKPTTLEARMKKLGVCRPR